jgi:DNA-binding transcriptional LysR family regulator
LDIALLKTFLAVSETGSFIAASERLHVTQSAVSLRVQRLEDMLGQPLFLRAKTGTELTPGGRAFQSHALALLQTWERARQDIARAEDSGRTLVVGAEAALWPRIGFRWLARLLDARTDLSLRCETATVEVLARSISEGDMQVCLTHGPVAGAGLDAEKITDDELVLVAPWAEPCLDDMPGRYALIDWGPDFMARHVEVGELAAPVLTLDSACPAVPFLRARGLAAYLPLALCKASVAAGKLSVVPDAPRVAQGVWAIWRKSLDRGLWTVARKTLLASSREPETGEWPAGLRASSRTGMAAVQAERHSMERYQ